MLTLAGVVCAVSLIAALLFSIGPLSMRRSRRAGSIRLPDAWPGAEAGSEGWAADMAREEDPDGMGRRPGSSFEMPYRAM